MNMIYYYYYYYYYISRIKQNKPLVVELFFHGVLFIYVSLSNSFFRYFLNVSNVGISRMVLDALSQSLRAEWWTLPS